jgi:hypothetical protein
MNNIYYLDANVYSPIAAKFSAEVKGTLYGKMLDERLTVLSKTAIGKNAPDIRWFGPEAENLFPYMNPKARLPSSIFGLLGVALAERKIHIWWSCIKSIMEKD